VFCVRCSVYSTKKFKTGFITGFPVLKFLNAKKPVLKNTPVLKTLVFDNVFSLSETEQNAAMSINLIPTVLYKKSFFRRLSSKVPSFGSQIIVI
jgi:hypothetical protein